ncbi:MAG TPA: hypothetical protein PK659_09590 [Methanothrix sp.]|nr:hypothetical protein [Methanothrix sp.]HOL44492.1 hypothetical protein [Methanothrix sp.]
MSEALQYGRMWMVVDVRYAYGVCRRCGKDVHEVVRERIEFLDSGAVIGVIDSPWREIRGTCEHVNVGEGEVDMSMVKGGVGRARVSPAPEELVRGELERRQRRNDLRESNQE